MQVISTSLRSNCKPLIWKGEKDLKKKTAIEGYICIILFVAMTITMFIEVIARYIFSFSLPWTGELTRYLFIWFIFISASYAVTEKAHIKVESIHGILPNRLKGIANLLGTIIWLGLTVLITYLGINYALSMFGSTSTALKIPMGVVYLGIPIGYGLMSIRILIQLIRHFKSEEKRTV